MTRRPSRLAALSGMIAWAALATASGCDRSATGSRGVPSSPVPAWSTLLDEATLEGWSPTEFGGEGEVYRRDGALVLEFGAPLTGVTWQRPFPRCDYELAFEATREAGYDFFCGLTFPVADSHCSLILGGWGGATCGLSSLDGRDAANNETKRLVPFTNGRAYAVRLVVRSDRVLVDLDGARLIDVSLTGRHVGIRGELGPSRPLGLASFLTRAVLANLRYRELR